MVEDDSSANHLVFWRQFVFMSVVLGNFRQKIEQARHLVARLFGEKVPLKRRLA